MRSIDLFRSSDNAPSETKEKQNIVEKAKGILAVVGDSEIQSTIEQSLESIGLEIIFVTSGEAADEFLSKRSAELVISEIDLPIMNGLTLARRIKEDAALGDVPVLLISDSSDGPDKVMGMETGADDYITLPINSPDLRSRVMSLLSRTKNELEDDAVSGLTEVDEPEDSPEETVIGAGAQSIPVDELGLGDADEASAETADLPAEAPMEQTDSVIMEELNPVSDLSDDASDAPLPEDDPVLEETEPERSNSIIIEEADPFSIQETSPIDDVKEEPIIETAESEPPEKVETTETDGLEESYEPTEPETEIVENVEVADSSPALEPETEIIEKVEAADSSPAIEPETEEPVPETVDDPGAESMIDDIFGSGADSDKTQTDMEESAPQTEPPPAEEVIAVQNTDIAPPAESPTPAQPVTPPEAVVQTENVSPTTIPADLPSPVQPQQIAPVLPQEQVAPPQPIETNTLIPADQEPVQAPPVIPPPAPIQSPPQAAPPIPAETIEPQIDMNEMALVEHDYNLRVDDKQLYETTILDLKELETKVTNGDRFTYNNLILDAKKIVSSVQQSNYLHIRAIGRREGQDFPVHSINVAIFSAKLATGLKYENKILTELALSALLHDVGMLLLPEGIRNAKNKLTDEEFATLRTHPNIGGEYIGKALQTNPELIQYGFLPSVVQQEHERFDGSGYPNGTAGDKIHDYAKIISIIDMYEAISHPSTYRDEYLAYEALQKVVALKDTYFDVKFLRALVREISVFPLESLVRLNNGDIGQVVELDNSHPMRPKLKILYNSDGEKYPEEKIIELSKSPFLYVETPITEEELVNKSNN